MDFFFAVVKTAKAIEDVLSASAIDARRLIRTESTYIANAAEMESYKELDIDKYEFVATLDMRTSDVCSALDGKTFPVKDGVPGVNMPPMHPWCRSTTIAVIDSAVTDSLKRRARDPETNELYEVPKDMTYEQWKNEIDGKYGAGFVDKKRKMWYNKTADEAQYKAYKDRLGDDAPETFVDFQKLKYDTPEVWESFKALVRSKNYLQQQLSYLWNGEKCFIPKHTEFENVVTIAGNGAEEDIHCINRLLEDYKGTVADGWQKRAGKIASDKYVFDVHWYEYDGIQYETKLKNRKERK